MTSTRPTSIRSRSTSRATRGPVAQGHANPHGRADADFVRQPAQVGHRVVGSVVADDRDKGDGVVAVEQIDGIGQAVGELAESAC